MNFFVYQQDFENPEVHLLDIYVGPEPPASLVGLRPEVFTDISDLFGFLKSVKVNQTFTFRHTLCPDDVIEELNNWIESNLPTKAIHQSENLGV